MKSFIFISALVSLLVPGLAIGWPTKLYSDAEVVARAELIVLAHVKKGSITKLIRQNGSSYEHRATLVVTNVIMGKVIEGELPIMIHYGLLPISASHEKNMTNGNVTVRSPPEEKGEKTRIWEDNPSMGFFRPSGDVYINQLWLLRHFSHPPTKDDPDVATTNLFGIWDPEDIQPATKEQVLKVNLLTR